MASSSSSSFTFNTLQRREISSLSVPSCKCFSSSNAISLHNSFAFSSPKFNIPLNFSLFFLVKAPVTFITPVNGRLLSSLNCSSSTETVDFSNTDDNLGYGYCKEGKNGRGFVETGRKSRNFGERLNFDVRSEKGKIGRGFVENGEKSRNIGERLNFDERNEKGKNGREFVENGGKSRNFGERLNFDERNEKGNNGRGFVENGEKSRNFGERLNFDERSDKGKMGSGFVENGGKSGILGERLNFDERTEKGSSKVSSFKRVYRRGEKKMVEIVDNVGVKSNGDDSRRDFKGSELRGQKGSKVSWRRSKEGNSMSNVVDRGVDRGGNRDDGSFSKVKKKEKVSKKDKPNSPEFQVRVGLDMCSKKGDVMGAISLYDSGVKEGLRMSQYHYTVLLYLCSSAAMGVVRPAKSGSGSRSLDMSATKNLDGSDDDSVEEEDDDSDDTDDEARGVKDQSQKVEVNEIRVSDDVKKYALEKGFEIYERMCLDKVQMNEAALTSVARMAMGMGDGDMAFEMVKQMKSMGINPRLRSYGPALSVFTRNGEIEKAFAVEEHMLENGVQPEEPELEALLRVSVEIGKPDRVYYVLQKLRTIVRSVSPSTADLIEKWFKSKEASRVGKRKWDHDMIVQTMENGGGGWHGMGWLGRGKWSVSRTSVGTDGLCKCCGEQLALIDLDPEETERFSESVEAIATKREKNSSFQKFQRWLDYYGPFEAVVDAANVGLFSQRKFKPSKVNVVVNGIRKMLPSRKWPLIVLHNRRVIGSNLEKPIDKDLVERWRNADALYATPTGSNDDWYWLYAAIKFKCLLVTNDEMRDHTFQLLGNDFFPKWKERHQVRFSFSELGPVFHMPPPFSVVIQESARGHWHIPIASEHQSEEERIWICITRPKSIIGNQSHIGGADSAEGEGSLTT